MIHFSETQKWLILAGGIIITWLLMQLSPILTPFLLAFSIAYLGTPLVDYMVAHNRPRLLSVLLVFSLFLLIFILLVLIVFPMLEQQLNGLILRLPVWIERFQQHVLPNVLLSLGLEESTDHLTTVQIAIIQHWQQAGGLAAYLVDYISVTGTRILAWLSNLFLIPVITFYLLIDWHVLLYNLRTLIPRRYENYTVAIVQECNDVLSAFLRGQMLVMLSLSCVYSIGLSLAQLEFALLFGLLAGTVSFVPYLGVVIGISSAGLAAFLQYQDLIHVGYVLAVFAFGQVLESFWLTPWLVGERIGLHPVAVIFAILAGGQLFGFLGILLALPMASILMVILRHIHQKYLSSHLYEKSY